MATLVVAALIVGALARASTVADYEVDLAGAESTTSGQPPSPEPTPTTTPVGGDPVQGGEVVDLATFAGNPPEHIDPLLAITIADLQVGELLYDGLTTVDHSDPDDPVVRGQVAESWEASDDATEWTFTIRDGLRFSDGSPVLPSSFVRAWEIGSEPDLGADYAFLYEVFEGGRAKLEGEASSISGIDADDDAMTLAVSLATPEAELPAILSSGVFQPMPEAREDLADQEAWDEDVMVGNGPFVLESPPDESRVVLVPNPEWDGTAYDAELALPEQPYLDRVTFEVTPDADTAYTAFEAGEGDTAPIPASRSQEAADLYTVPEGTRLGTYFFLFNDRDELVGGSENLLLRRAISQAIDREEITELIFGATRVPATGVTPPGVPGFDDALCAHCSYDPDAAEADFQAWLDEGNELDEPVPVQFNAGVGHEEVAELIVDDLAAVGIDATAEPTDGPTYFEDLAAGECVLCRSGWIADYPAYGNFMYDLFHSDQLDANNYGFDDPGFDELIDEARAETDPDARAGLFREAEHVLLNEQVGVVPINWYASQLVYGDSIGHLYEDPSFHVHWETAYLAG